ncbi:MAG: aminotransferase class V-fold PLP-dependent enzyme [Balneolaceae bacterium]|nr:aminotransferase class V-fold PLP-dependent enzyme [Balneolaceae bacterium]
MHSRKDFLKYAGGIATGMAPMPWLHLEKTGQVIEQIRGYSGSAKAIAQNEDFWAHIQKAYTVDRSLINLNNGGVSPAPEFVQDAMKKHLDYSHKAPTYTMKQVLKPQKETVRGRLARMLGTDTEEIAIVRNSSEGLQICQQGFDLEAGDEVLTTTHDYPRMINTFKQRERRDGIKLRQFPIPIPAEDDEEIVRLFESNITSKTKLILMCHMINITGQILPVKKVVRMARKYDIPVIVDGAHTFAHFDFDHSDLDCDYYATSLHKWLCAPFGTGMLYVKKDNIDTLWPLLAAPERLDSDIRKFEEFGTHPDANFIAIAEAMTFHQGIGSKRKEERLRFLNNYWIDQVIDTGRIKLHTSRKSKYACGIVTVEITGVNTRDLEDYLWNKHKIITVGIVRDDFEGIRVTPHVYTTLEELDRFSDALHEVINNGL